MSEISTKGGTQCPHCEAELTPEEIKRLWAFYTTSLRKTLGGPERQKRACPSCGMDCDSARGAWSHCRIPRNLDAEALLAYVLGRKPKELVRLLGGQYGNLEALQTALNGILKTKLKPSVKRQALWYLSYVDKAMDKLEDAA